MPLSWSTQQRCQHLLCILSSNGHHTRGIVPSFFGHLPSVSMSINPPFLKSISKHLLRVSNRWLAFWQSSPRNGSARKCVKPISHQCERCGGTQRAHLPSIMSRLSWQRKKESVSSSESIYLQLSLSGLHAQNGINSTCFAGILGHLDSHFVHLWLRRREGANKRAFQVYSLSLSLSRASLRIFSVLTRVEH